MRKKQLFLLSGLLVLLVVLVMCKSEDDVVRITPTMSSAPYFSKTKNIEFTSNGGEQNISFSINKSWDLKVPVSWCKVTPESGDKGDNVSVKIVTDPNDTFEERNATLTLKAQDSICTLVVTQKQKDALTLTRAKYELGVEGGVIDVEVKANIGFTVEIPEKYREWIRQQNANPTKALTSNHISFYVEPSTEYNVREGEIIIKGETVSETLKIYQSGDAVLVLTNKEFDIPSKGGDVTVEIKSNFDFGVQMPDVEWIKTNMTKSVSTHTLYYTIAANESDIDREADIVYFDKNSDKREIVKIKQSKRMPNYQVTLNVDDPHILSVKTPENETISLYGRKDEEGLAQSIEQISIVNEKGENLDIVVDENLRPTNIRAFNGVSFSLEWLSDTQVILTAFDSNSNIQVNTIIDRSQAIEPVVTKATTTMSSRSGDLELKIRPITDILETRSEITQGGIILSVKQCDSPFDATTWINVYNNTTGNLLTRLVKKGVISTGKYYYECPTSVFPTISASDIINGINNVVGKVCLVNDFITAGYGPLLCPAIASALITTGIGVVAAPEFFVACEAVTVGVNLICSTIGASAAPGAPTILDALAEAEFLKKEYNIAAIKLVPVVDALPDFVYGESVVLQPSQTSAQLGVDLGGVPRIRSFDLIPSAPLAGQSYVAVADLFCIPVGSIVYLSIVGTDGYANSITTMSSTTNFEAELHVPGASMGVKDVCTVKITYPSGESITRQAALVFQ